MVTTCITAMRSSFTRDDGGGITAADLRSGIDLSGCSALLRKHDKYLNSDTRRFLEAKETRQSEFKTCDQKLTTRKTEQAKQGSTAPVACMPCSSRGIRPLPTAELASDPCGCTKVCRKCGMKMATGGKCRICNTFFRGFRAIGDMPSMDVEDMSDGGDSSDGDGHSDWERTMPSNTHTRRQRSQLEVGEVALEFITALDSQDPGRALRLIDTVGDLGGVGGGSSVGMMHISRLLWVALPELRAWRLLQADRSAQPGEKMQASTLARMLHCICDDARLIQASGIPVVPADSEEGREDHDVSDGGECYNSVAQCILKRRDGAYTWDSSAKARQALWAIDANAHAHVETRQDGRGIARLHSAVISASIA